MPVTPSKNPLNSFRSSITINDFRFPPLPSLAEHIGARDQFDALAEKWRQDVERQINERLKILGVAVTQTDLDALRTQITALINSSSVVNAPVDLSGLQAEINSLVSRVTILEAGEVGETPATPETDALTIEITLTEDAVAGDVIDSMGKIVDSADASHFGRVVGIAFEDGSAGDSIRVVQSGVTMLATWTWTTGDVIFINGTGLSVTPPATGFLQSVGTAIDPMRILVQLGAPTATAQTIGDAFADPNGNVTPIYPSRAAMYYQTGALNLWTWNVGTQAWDQLIAP